MAIFKCKMCGGTIEFEQGATVGVCDSCGTKQTLPRLDDDRKANLYDRANHFRRNNEFDKAMGIYEQILNKDSADAEAYWSLVLCKYGIEYVEDPATHKRVPTVNRAQYTSIFADEDYKSAIEHADGYQKDIYESEAKAIDEIQKGILDISSKEEPFDVFICYKETDANGRRTPDSVLATELYHELTRDGFKVFFSRITLEDKLGQEYEPYIFAALNSAKVMVVLGTKAEHFNAVWVKNEWSRYLSLIKNGARKILIPAYKDMDPYDLPEEFSHLQAQDMSRLGFMQDLIRGIKKMVSADEQKPVVKETVINTGVVNVAPLLKRAFIFLEDGDWQSADEYCEKVLDQDPENADAYLGKLMAELKVNKQEQLKDCEQPFDSSNNYQKAVRYGDAKLSESLKNCLKCIVERNENARLEGIYTKAKVLMSTAVIDEQFNNACDLFKTISGYKDSDVLAEQCLEGANRCREENKEKERRLSIEKSKRVAEREKKIKKIIAFSTVGTIICAFFAVIVFTIIIPNNKYNGAVKKIDEGNIISGYENLIGLKNYKDSVEKAKEIQGEYYKSKLKNAKTGDSLFFGLYEQDNNDSTGKEAIEWQVLKKDNNSLFLISRYAIDCQQYDSTDAVYKNTVWEDSSIREWLNDDFYNSAFNAEEKEMVITTKVQAEKREQNGPWQGNNTTDRVFLLSKSEFQIYFSAYESGKCLATKYLKNKSGDFIDANGNCQWWLRSTGSLYSSNAAYVDFKGRVYVYGAEVSDYCAVRPVLWIGIGD